MVKIGSKDGFTLDDFLSDENRVLCMKYEVRFDDINGKFWSSHSVIRKHSQWFFAVVAIVFKANINTKFI